MSTTTTNYNLVKPALTDSPPDITAMNPNWDAIDAELKNLNTNKLGNSGDSKSNTVSFTEAVADADIATGESHATLFGKILKRFKVMATTISNIVDGTTKVAKAANADKVGGFTVGKSVPANAAFTDTLYSHPASHPASMITGLPTSLPADGGTSAACSGNAASATKLATARNINGVSFDGTASITVADETKAPKAHASSSTTYGVGTTTNYGHCKTINGLTQSSHVNGTALSAYQGYVLGSVRLAGKTLWVGAEGSKGTNANTIYFCY